MTHTKDEALKLALDALKALKHGNLDHTWADEAITAIKQALAAPVQEPVAWGIIASNTGRICQVELDADEIEGHNPKHIVPLYTTPPAQPAPVQELTNLQRHEQNVQKFLAAQPADTLMNASDEDRAEFAQWRKDKLVANGITEKGYP
jgi:uncharacterized linocin/CFP29 family protein